MLELMVAVAILAILLLVAIPSFSNAGLPSQLRAVSNKLIGAVQFARSSAIERDAVVTLCASADGQNCDAAAGNWNEGWIVTSAGLAEPLLAEPAAPHGYHVTPMGGAVALAFQPTGIGATPESFTVCRASPTSGAQERVVRVSAVGHASVQATANGVCP